ncbi:MAG: cytochrome c biogenesis protein CcsA [Desulfobulbaceae bacterium]|nr:cytochrome c biogenesis protein CcsA [Desulfobulbaceae bacterium]
MNLALLTTQFSQIGQILISLILVISVLAGALGMLNAASKQPVAIQHAQLMLLLINLLFLVGFALICWLHYRIYLTLPLQLPKEMVPWLNQEIGTMNATSAYAFPLFDPSHPPRYIIPLWVENEKYYFWFMCYAIMAFLAFRRSSSHRLQGTLLIFAAAQALILFTAANPFNDPLPKFFSEIRAWFSGGLNPMQQFGEFMRIYPKMIFYYNTPYMWLHPPMLFLSYSAITITFITSGFMLLQRDFEIETLGYDYAKFGYFMLTLGMLLGYPWALQAWGPNWWWDPKICSSIMMWAIYSTFLHTRLYANKRSMWYFTSILGILCFVAMVFTFVSSFYFPGEHTFQ